jgi:hypothetical protein
VAHPLTSEQTRRASAPILLIWWQEDNVLLSNTTQFLLCMKRIHI